jgi:predicted transcriptional regulator
MQRRSKQEIMLAILNACGEAQNLNNITFACRLNFKKCADLVDWMISKGWIEKNGKMFKISDSGRVVREKLQEMVDLMA